MATERSQSNEAAVQALQDAVKTLQAELNSLRKQAESKTKPSKKRSKGSRVNDDFELPAEQNLFAKLPAEVRLNIWREALTSNRDIAFKCWPVYLEDSSQSKRGGKKQLFKWKIASDNVPSLAPISCYNSLKLVCQLTHSDQKSPSAFYKYNTFAARNVGALNRLVHTTSQANLESIRDVKLGDHETTLEKLWNNLHVSLLALKSLRTFVMTWNDTTRPQKEWYQLSADVGKVVHSLPLFRRFTMCRKRQPGTDTIVIDRDDGIEVKLIFHKYGRFDYPAHIRTRDSDMELLYPIWRRLIKWEASDEDDPEIVEHSTQDRLNERINTITATFSMEGPDESDSEEDDDEGENKGGGDVEDGEDDGEDDKQNDEEQEEDSD